MSKVFTTEELDALEKHTTSKVLTTEELDALEAGQRKSHGASGSWTEMGPGEKAARAVLGPPARFGKAVVDTGSAILHSPVDIYNAATTVNTPEEQALAKYTGPGGLVLHKLLIQPTEEHAKAWVDSLYEQAKHYDDPQVFLDSALKAVATIPIVGPMVESVANRARSGDVAGALGEGATYAVAPKLIGETAGYVKGHPIFDMAKDYVNTKVKGMQTPTAALVTRALNPSDRAFQRHFETGMSELKQAEFPLGELKTLEDYQKAVKVRTSINNGMIDQIVKPQADITYPGSAKMMQDYQMSKIPEDIRNNPRKYATAVRDIKAYHPQDFTLGELNRLRSELSATQSPFYGKDLSGQLTMDAGARATDIARGEVVRKMFYEGLDKYGLGGGQAAATINGRIGSLIHFSDALMDKANTAVAQGGNVASRFKRMTEKVTSPSGKGSTINEDLALAMKRWDKPPAPIEVQLREPMGPSRLLPARTSFDLGAGPDASKVHGTPAIYSPPGRPKLLPARAGGPYAMGTGEPAPGTGPSTVTGEKGTPSVGPFKTAVPETLSGKQTRMSLPSGPIEKTNKSGPGPLFRMSQSAPGEGIIPPGTKLIFKSKGLFGRDMYHYETPTGEVFSLDRELPAEITNPKGQGPYEEGTSWKGSPYKPQEPTPPPRLRGKKKS